jgi:CRP-like cAMP-binding protein
MYPPARKNYPDIRIRAVEPWTPEHGKEAPHLTLSAADKADLGRIAELIEYKTARSQILFQGQTASFLYLLADGVALACRSINDGERQILAFYWPGDLFGLAERGTYVNSAEAVTPCTIYRFPIGRLETFLLENPNIQHSFFIKAVHDLRSAQRRLVVLGRLDVPKRLAVFLLDCSGHEQYFDPATHVLSVPMTRYDIADYLGTSAESVTRAFGQLEGKGLLHRLTARTLELRSAGLKAFVDLE